MDLSKYKYFFVHGCSNCEGGGLEEPAINKNSKHELYKEKYGLEWNTRKDVNFVKRLSDIIEIKHINYAKSGAGVERIVRETYEFIQNNWKDKDKFFIILEKPDPGRIEVFYAKNKSYYIINTQKGTDGKLLDFSYATREYFNYPIKDEDIKYQNDFEEYFNNFYDFFENLKKTEFMFAGLYSFCKQNGIKIFLMNKNEIYLTDTFANEDIITFKNGKETGNISEWCIKMKYTISDELGGNVKDFHPGYYGHIEYAKNLAIFLGYKIQNKLL
jgi:hypothetical protein